jgi:hypothetical protein
MEVIKMFKEMNYRQLQNRNTVIFKKLTKSQQKDARKQGYYNVGREKVKSSWDILCVIQLPLPPDDRDDDDDVVDLFKRKIIKNDISGAVAMIILESENIDKIAQEGLSKLDKLEKQFNEKADKILKKYPIL